MVSWPWSKPSEQELLKACKKAETEARIAQKDADALQETVPGLNGALATVFHEDRIRGVPVTSDAISNKSTVMLKAYAHGSALTAGRDAMAAAQAALEAGDNKSAQYKNATPHFNAAAGHFKAAVSRGQEATKAHAAALKAQDDSRRIWEKSQGLKQYATACIAPVAELASRLSGNEFVDDAEHAAFLSEQEAGLKAYNNGKGGYYEAATDHLTKAMDIGNRALNSAAERRQAYDAGMRTLNGYEQDITDITSAIAAPGTTPDKIYLYIKANGGSYTDPSRFTDLVYRYTLKLKKGDFKTALDTDIPGLGDSIKETKAAIAGTKALEADREKALQEVEAGSDAVIKKAEEVLTILEGDAYKDGRERFKKIAGKYPKVGDLSGVTSFIQSTLVAAQTTIANTMKAEDIAREAAEFRQTMDFAIEGIEVIRQEAKYLAEMQDVMATEKEEAAARQAFETMLDDIQPKLHDLDLWQWDGFAATNKSVRALVAAVPADKTWTAGEAELKALKPTIDAAHRDKHQAMETAKREAGEKEAAVKALYDQVYAEKHKIITLGYSSGNQLLEAVKEKMDFLALLNDGTELGALGALDLCRAIEDDLNTLKNTGSTDFNTLDTLRSDVEKAIKAAPLSALQPTRSGTLKTTFTDEVWVQARRKTVDLAKDDLNAFKTRVQEAQDLAGTIKDKRELAKTEVKQAGVDIKTITQQAKDMTKKDEDPVKTLRGPITTHFDALSNYIKLKDYPISAPGEFSTKIEALKSALDALGSPHDIALAVEAHRAVLDEEKRSAEALIAWQQKCDLLKADIARLRTFLAEHEEGDPSDADDLAKQLKHIEKMVKDSGEAGVGDPQLKAIAHRVDTLHKNPRDLRAPAMEALAKAPARWRSGVQETVKKLDALHEVVTARVKAEDDLARTAELILKEINRLKEALSADEFNKVCTLLTNAKVPRDRRRKIKEEGLRQVRAVRALWNDPAARRLMFNPFGVKGVFSDTYKALDVMEFELVRFPA